MRSTLQTILSEFASDKKLLLAVSGGVDSMSLLHALHSLGHYVEVAHCNFKLRGSESDTDQSLVQSTCLALGIPFHTTSFQTDEIAKSRKAGTQEVARDLRYEWFDALLEERQLDLITTAHQAEDQTETIVMNFIRGSGAAGLGGMHIIRGNRFRPLLGTSKNAIVEYAREHQVEYREDSSNASTKYRRNKIRLEVNPVLREMNPNLDQTLASQAGLMREIQAFLINKLPEVLSEFSAPKINIENLLSSGYPTLVLGEIFSADDLSREQLTAILNLSQAQTGSYFKYGELTVTRNRDELVVSRKENNEINPVQLDSLRDFENTNFHAEEVDAQSAKFSGPHEVWLDVEKVNFPLTLRKWTEGDRFQPLGMKGSQKVSDLLVQRKVSREDKSRVMVLCIEDEILWIPNHHSSDKFKLTENSKRALHISCR